ncbi:MAG: FHA domain-containing protein [Myxococcales bacterium]|nr:FHA domain-containing protein [Myxococcales bacterium]
MPTLIINESGSNKSSTHRCTEEQITLGRLKNNTIQLPAVGVSRQHAKILYEGENFFIVDLDSGNGTFLNGARLSPNERNLLQPGDNITIDNYQIKFHAGDAPFEHEFRDEVTESDILEVKLLKKVLNAIDRETVPNIEVLNGASEGKKFVLADEISEIVIGRDPECDFPINEHVISRKHVKIMRRWGGIAIRDLESKNGTFLNNRRIVEEYLHDGDRIALGTIVLMFRNPQEINLANIEDIKPKNVPARVALDEIPGAEEGSEEPQEENAYDQENEEGDEGDDIQTDEGGSAVERWEELEREALGQSYPELPKGATGIKSLTPIEIGMIGLGALVLIFAIITIVNLINS